MKQKPERQKNEEKEEGKNKPQYGFQYPTKEDKKPGVNMRNNQNNLLLHKLKSQDQSLYNNNKRAYPQETS